MPKANQWVELLGLDGFFYKDMDIFLVTYPNHKTERHYYKVDEKSKVLVFKDENDKTKNPEIRGSGLNYDARTKKNIYKWYYGAPYAVPLNSDDVKAKAVITDDDIHDLVNLGMAIERLNTSSPPKNLLGNMPMLIIIILIGVIVNIMISYKIADHFGLIKEIMKGISGG